MPLITQSQQDFIDQFIAAFAALTGITPVPSANNNNADPLLGLADATSANAIFLQYQSQYTNNFARLQTCTGPDVDSFCAQFNFFRGGAQFASGQVTLSVPLPVPTQLVIPIGTIIQTTAGNIQYQLVADTNQASYSASLKGYVLTANGPTSITASVQALVAGSDSNVQESLLIAFGTSSYGFSAVTNLAPITNGADKESDADFIAGFEIYIQSLSKGTLLAILGACQVLFPDFTYTVLNNTTPQGNPEPGWFTVIANNPGETVTSDQVAALQAAMELIRAFTVQSSVIAATPVLPQINMNIALAPTAVTSTVTAAVQQAIIGYVNSLPTGAKLYITNLIDVAINTSDLITSVENLSVTIGGYPIDFQPGIFEVVQANVDTVLIGVYNG